jgi:peptide/nickel transport system substrate-binding protein
MTYLEPPRPDPKGNPYIEHVKDQYVTRRIGRKDFLRLATCLGVSVPAASLFLAACGGDDEAAAPATPTATVAGGATTGGAEEMDVGGQKVVMGDFGPEVAGTPVRGGTYRIASQVATIDHPHRLSFGYSANILRQSFEYLTYNDRDNIAYPYLLESWDVNETVDVWTLNLRQGIKWSDGKDFTADDVLYNFASWFDPKVGSSVFGLIDQYLTPDGVEKVDTHTVRLNLKHPYVGVPYDLFHYPAQIIPQGWEPPDVEAGESLVPKVIGTGPYLLQEFEVGQRARVTRNPEYWQAGRDGQPLPYIEEITWTDLGPDVAAHTAALEGGQVDTIFELGPDVYQQFKDDDRFWALTLETAQCNLYRMRVDMEPFTDVNVRTAFKLLQDRPTILNTSYFGLGTPNFDAHFAPSHPDFVQKEIPDQQIEEAKRLLAESEVWQAWGNKPLKMTAKNDTRAEPIMAELYQQAAQQAGIAIELDVRPASNYWPEWNNYHFGVTSWGHRPLATMVNALAYTKAALPTKDAPGGWNETRWTNDEFERLLNQATATVDIEERKQITSQMEDIQIAEAGIGVAYFWDGFQLDTRRVKGNLGHPFNWSLVTRAWIEE